MHINSQYSIQMTIIQYPSIGTNSYSCAFSYASLTISDIIPFHIHNAPLVRSFKKRD